MSDQLDPAPLLEAIGFDATDSVLTRRQAEVLVLREEGHAQAAIASMLGTSRANVSSVEASARENLRKATETVAFAQALRAPVQLRVEAETELYDVPQQVYEACDESGVKVSRTAPELMKLIGEEAGDAVRGRVVHRPISITVTGAGQVRVRPLAERAGDR